MTLFHLWTIYRSKVIPIMLAVALLSIVFSNALVAEQSLPPAKVNELVAINLFAASLLMLLHGVYLGVMSYHLVYRLPIHPPHWFAAFFLLIVFAYFSHALHAFNEAFDLHLGGLLATHAASTGAFALAYIAFVLHALHDRKHRRNGPADPVFSRPMQRARETWMLCTDCAISLITVALTFHAMRGIPGYDGLKSQLVTYAPDLPITSSVFIRELTEAIHRQASEKDIVIFFALILFFLARWQVRRKAGSAKQVLFPEVIALQSLVPDPTLAGKLRQWLPPKSADWLDLGCGQGTQLHELLNLLFRAGRDGLFPSHVTFLDRKKAATASAKAKLEEWLQKPSSLTIATAKMNSATALAHLQKSRIVHMAHVCYTPEAVSSAVGLLRQANPDTLLILRYTSGASYYRTISAAMNCAPFLPYTYNVIHDLLMEDLKHHGWNRLGSGVLTRHANIAEPKQRATLVKWCDISYGEFAGNIVDRYLEGLSKAGEKTVLNSDWLVVLKKQGLRQPAGSD